MSKVREILERKVPTEPYSSDCSDSACIERLDTTTHDFRSGVLQAIIKINKPCFT